MRRTLYGTTSAIALSILVFTIIPQAAVAAPITINVHSISDLEKTDFYKSVNPSIQEEMRTYVAYALANPTVTNSRTTGKYQINVHPLTAAEQKTLDDEDARAKANLAEQKKLQAEQATKEAQRKAVADAKNASIQRIRDKMLEAGITDPTFIDKAKDEIREAERKANNTVTKNGQVYASTEEILSSIDYSKATPETDALLESMRSSLDERNKKADANYAALARQGVDSTWSMGAPEEGQYKLLWADYTARPDGFIYDPNGKKVAGVDFSAGKIFDLSGNQFTGTQREYYDNLMRSAQTITGDPRNAAAAKQEIVAAEAKKTFDTQSQVRALLQTIGVPKEGTAKLGTGTIDSKGIILDANGKKLGRYAGGQIFESPYQNSGLGADASVLQALGMMGNYYTPMFDFSWPNAATEKVRKLNNGYTINYFGILKDSSGKPVANVEGGYFQSCDFQSTGDTCVGSYKPLSADLVSTYIEAFRIDGGASADSGNSKATLKDTTTGTASYSGEENNRDLGGDVEKVRQALKDKMSQR